MDDVGQMVHTTRKGVDEQTDRLVTAAGGTVTDPARAALRTVAAVCGPDSIEALIGLLHTLGSGAPRHIGRFPVVAFLRYRTVEGTGPVRGVAITSAGSGRFNVHTVYRDENTGRWVSETAGTALPGRSRGAT